MKLGCDCSVGEGVVQATGKYRSKGVTDNSVSAPLAAKGGLEVKVEGCDDVVRTKWSLTFCKT